MVSTPLDESIDILSNWIFETKYADETKWESVFLIFILIFAVFDVIYDNFFQYSTWTSALTSFEDFLPLIKS